MSIQTIEQKRARYALKKVKNVSKAEHSEWLSRANEMPAMIQMNGLGQTAAFYLSKGGVHEKMYDLLAAWLCEKDKMSLFAEDDRYKKEDNDKTKFLLMQAITECDMPTYRIAQAEAQALLIWVKKFSKAYCKGE